ncbi:MAG: tyrosine-type recombinase/integrase [Promethearchaeota archaeon]|jgi:integrase/recombinase XerD
MNSYINFLTTQKGVAPATVSAYKTDIKQFLQYGSHEEWIQALHDKGITNSSKRRKITVIQNYCKYIGEPCKLVKPKNEAPLPKFLQHSTVMKIIDNTPHKRDKLMFRLLYETGMRISEAINLKWSQEEVSYDLEDIHTFLVKGKGSKERLVYVGNQLYTELKQLGHDDLVFGRKYSRTLFHMNLKKIVKKLSLSEKISLHSFRHSFATHLVNNDMRIEEISQLLGHSNVSTTSIYAKLSDDKLKQNFKLIRPKT